MSVTKTPNGRFRAIVKDGRRAVTSKTFDLKRDAQTWHDQEKRRLSLGESIDPKAGKEAVSAVRDRYLAQRRGTVAETTWTTDASLLNEQLPTRFRNLPISAVRSADVDDVLTAALRGDMARSSVVRLRAALSGLFGWAVRSNLIAKNPVSATRVQKGAGTAKRHEVYPFDLAELRAVLTAMKEHHAAQAEVARVLAFTGLRWGELRALRVRDFQRVPYAAVRVSRNAPEGFEERTQTKSGRARTVPLADELIELFEQRSLGKGPNDLLFTSPKGKQLASRNWRRATAWDSLDRGRRIHDLRHTAATLWLSNGVDPKTVQQWLGHESMTLTVDLYSHWMGSDADIAAMKRVNAVLGNAGGTSAPVASPAKAG